MPTPTRSWYRRIAGLAGCAIWLVCLLAATGLAGADRDKSQLSFWGVDGQPAAVAAVSKAAPQTERLIDPPSKTSLMRLEADTAIRCDGYWQGEPALRSVGWVVGVEVYVSYQDPSEVVCVNTYPFTILDVFWVVQVDVGQWITMQPIIATNAGVPECPFPGTLLCSGPSDSLYFEPGAWMVQMPIDDGCVVTEPYFAGVYLPNAISDASVDLVFDDNQENPTPCRSYNDWGEGWADLSQVFPNMILWSEGNTEASPTCACDCHGDPQCDGETSVLDVVQVVNIGFRGSPDIADPNAACPYVTTDVNCDGVTSVLDVVLLVNVAFRGGDRAAQFCNPCP
ncbi:MAG TPA: hypothetical protein VM118_09755 [Acidobacteriota bacterium]|nr:hypothetical protein [Acidobacteriota bacterium]